MPATIDRVLLFPGQGAFRDGEPARFAARHPHLRQVFDEVDRVALELGARPPGPVVLTSGGEPLERLAAEAPDVLQLAIFATSVGLWSTLQDAGPASEVLAGHSSGEIAALVAAGAFTVAEGAEIIVHRSAALAELGRPIGGMVALGCDPGRAQRVLDAVGNPLLTVAVRNGTRQVVASGPAEALTTTADVAHALGIGATPLVVAYPFHSPALGAAVPAFAARIRHIEPRPLRTLVYSPILGRFHRAGDDLAEHIASALVAPVDFDRALSRLYELGARRFVECATAGALTRIVKRSLPDVTAVLAQAPADPGPAPALPSPEPAVEAVPVSLPVDAGDRGALFAELVEMYAGALEYPAEVFTEDVLLEADLGIDSVKQTELMARAAERYGLPEPAADFRLGDYDTMGKLVDHLYATRGTGAQPPPEPAVKVDPVSLPVDAGDRGALFAELVEMYAGALEYPAEVFTEDVLLEADLGIDSVKQTELMARAAERYGLPEPAADFRLGDYDTMGKLVDYLHATRGAAVQETAR